MFNHTSIIQRCKRTVEGRYWPLILLLLLVLFAGLRLVYINGDSGADISFSAAPYTDEGLKTFASTNEHYYGVTKWTPEDQYKGWSESSPFATWLYAQWFSLLGVSYFSLRLLPVLFSVGTAFLLFCMMKRFYNIYSAFAVLILYCFNYFIVQFNRLSFFENILNFFIVVIFFSLCEMFRRRSRLKEALINRRIRTWQELVMLFVAVTAGGFATIAGVFTKQSLSMVIVSIIPFTTLYFFYTHKKLNKHIRIKFYTTVAIIVTAYIVLGNFGFLDSYLKEILHVKVFGVPLGYILPLKQGISNFDPFYLTFIKSLYLEFVFLQPLVFFTAIFFALHTYNNLLYRMSVNILDMVVSTWFLFGFLFLSIMRYHPARYYLLLLTPMLILASRFFTSGQIFSVSDLLPEKMFSLRKLIIALFWFYLVYYLAISVLNAALPFSFKRKLYNFAYQTVFSGNLEALMPPVLGLLAFIAIFFIIGIRLQDSIKSQMRKRGFYYYLFIFIICFQFFQTGKWGMSVTHNLHDASVKLGSMLPPKSVLAGCWSAGLGVENRFRPLVIQDRMDYNVNLLDTLIAGDEISVYDEHERGSLVKESALPVYLVVSRNGVFDRKLIKKYKMFLDDKNLVYQTVLGLFEVEVYKLR